jgi:hypothetical protein
MSSIDEQANVIDEVLVDEVLQEEQPASGGGFGISLPDWLWIPRLDEPVEKYMTHSFNFSKSEGVAYIIRGFSALGGGLLNYWWTDVVGGFLRLRMESKKVAE